MKLHQVIIHELQKQGGKTGAKLRSSNGLMDATNEEVINLITELNNRYKNRNEYYGVFDESNKTRFHDEFSTFFDDRTDDSFISFSKNVSNDLKEKVDTVAPAKGGYLIFASYTEQRDFIGVFLIRDTQGVILKRSSSVRAFDIGKVEHIDFEKMAMACRINLKSFSTKAERYLSFINRKSDSISKYFTSWISSTDTETNEQDTLHLYKILKAVDPPQDDTGKQYEREVFMDTVYRYVNSLPEKQVNLRELGKTYFGDEGFLVNYAHENDIPINTEFKGHSKVLKRFIQIRAKADNIELAFQHSQFKSVVTITGSDKIIITSEALVNRINQQMKGDA
jgi:nucleoid-associated protein